MEKYNFTIRYLDRETHEPFQETHYVKDKNYGRLVFEQFASLKIPITNIWRYDAGELSATKKMIFSRKQGWLI